MPLTAPLPWLFPASTSVSALFGVLAVTDGPTASGVTAAILAVIAGGVAAYVQYSREQTSKRRALAEIEERESMMRMLSDDNKLLRTLVESSNHYRPVPPAPPVKPARDTDEWRAVE